MKPTPPDWPRLSASLFYDDPHAAIDFLCKAFGFQRRLVVEGEGGRIVHSELDFGEALVMIGEAGKKASENDLVPMASQSPRSLGGAVTQAVALFVDDVDAHCAQAEANGAVIAMRPMTNDYGDDYWVDRSYRAVDPEGHHWWFMQRLATRGKPHGS